MFRVISLIIWIIVTTLVLLWFLNNSGTITLIWLGYEVQISVLTALLSFIIIAAAIFLIYRIISAIISLTLGFFGIFKTNELKKRDKIIKKYEEAIVLFSNFLTVKNKKESKSLQKKINSLLKNKELKESLENSSKEVNS